MQGCSAAETAAGVWDGSFLPAHLFLQGIQLRSFFLAGKP